MSDSALIQELTAARAEVERLRAVQAELVAACKRYRHMHDNSRQCCPPCVCVACQEACAAIAKAK